MLNRPTHFTAAVFAVAASALMFLAPAAGADDAPACAPDDQKCQEQQNQGQQIAGEVVDQVQQGVDQAKQGMDAMDPDKNGRPATGLYVLLNGVPTCMPFGMPVSAMDRVEVVPGYPNHGRCS